jgi:predicted metal-binding membrane protein
MASARNVLGGIVLIAAGVYQWTPLKDVCLAQCQTLLLGLRHGGYFVGCCWLLMAILFVGGVMNVLWIALLALLVLLEKVTPFGRRVARAAGGACVVAGAWMLLSSPQ